MSKQKKLMRQIEDQAIVWLTTLNSSNVTQAQEDEFFIWLNKSPLHQAAYIKAEDMWQRGEVLQQLPEKIETTSSWNQWQGWTAACVSVVLVAFAFFFVIANKETHYEYQTVIGEQKDIHLEDGSHLVLNTNSKIDITFKRKSRIANLSQGEIFFDVAADKSRPFDVVTQSGVVRVVGTHFAIRTVTNDTVVTVIEGKVALGQRNDDGKEFISSVFLQANQRLSFSGVKTGVAPETLDATRELSWRSKQLVYKGQPLGQVIADLNRYFPVAIILADQNLASREITAVIRLADIKTTLQALTQPLNLSAEFDSSGNKVTLVAAPSPQ